VEPAGSTPGKKINGVKRHLLVDTLGLVWAVVVHSAGIQDRDGARLVLAKAKVEGTWPRMQVLWADGGYAGWLVGLVFALFRWTLTIIKRTDDAPGFRLLPKRWVVERTFGWLSNYRRLSRHYEFHDGTGEAMIHVAMIHVMVRRLRPDRKRTPRRDRS
jgi:putative transposase